MSVDCVGVTPYLNLMLLEVGFVFEIHVLVVVIVVDVVAFSVLRRLWSVLVLDDHMIRFSERTETELPTRKNFPHLHFLLFRRRRLLADVALLLLLHLSRWIEEFVVGSTLL